MTGPTDPNTSPGIVPADPSADPDATWAAHVQARTRAGTASALRRRSRRAAARLASRLAARKVPVAEVPAAVMRITRARTTAPDSDRPLSIRALAAASSLSPETVQRVQSNPLHCGVATFVALASAMHAHGSGQTPGALLDAILQQVEAARAYAADETFSVPSSKNVVDNATR